MSRHLPALLFAAVLWATAWPQTPGLMTANNKLTTEDFGHGVYNIGGGTNSILAIGKDAAILVDAKANGASNLAAAVKVLTRLPVKYVVNSHHHRDHTAANVLFAEMGATIVATPNAAKHMAESSPNPRGGPDNPGLPAAGLPTITYDQTTTISVDGQSVKFIPVRRSHTDGDAIIQFKQANVLLLGDLHHSNEYPVWDAAGGCQCGSYGGNLEVYYQILKLADAKTKIVPGHGGVTNKQELTIYVAMLVKVRDQVRDLMAAGKSADEVVAAKLLADDHAPQPGGPDNRDNFIRSLYNALKSGQGA